MGSEMCIRDRDQIESNKDIWDNHWEKVNAQEKELGLAGGLKLNIRNEYVNSM